MKTVGSHQAKAAGATSSALVIPPGGDVADGNRVVLTIALDPASGAVSCSDSVGNAYSVDADVGANGAASGARLVICSAHLTTALAAGDVITVTHPSLQASAFTALAFSNIVAASAVDAAVTLTGSGSTVDFARLETVQPHVAVVVAGALECDATVTGNINEPVTELAIHGTQGGSDESNISIHAGYRILTTTDELLGEDALSRSCAWASVQVAYRDIVPPDSTAPAPPTLFNDAENMRIRNEAEVSWTGTSDPDTGIAAYLIERSRQGSGTWTPAFSAKGHERSNLDRPGDGTWLYRAQARDGAGNLSDWSYLPLPIIADALAPSAPSGVSAVLDGSGSRVTVTWSPMADNGDAGLAAFDVERSSDGGSTWEIAGSTGESTFELEDVPGTGTFQYRVRARDVMSNISSPSADAAPGAISVSGAAPVADVLSAPCPGNGTFRRAIALENPGPAVNDVAIPLTLDTAALISEGSLRPDCADLRFFGATDATALPYFVESGCNTGTTRLWLRLPSLPAGTTTLQLGHGDAVASDVQSRPAVAIRSDDFSQAPQGNPLWTDFLTSFNCGAGGSFGWTGNTVALTDTSGGCQNRATFGTIDPEWENAFAVSFDFRITGGTGADGISLGFFHEGVTPLGPGAALAGAGRGYVLLLDTYQNSFEPIAQKVLLANWVNLDAYPATPLGFAPFPALRDGAWHSVSLRFVSNRAQVVLDGVRIIDVVGTFDKSHRKLTLGAATGAQTDFHEVDNLTVMKLPPAEISVSVGQRSACSPAQEQMPPSLVRAGAIEATCGMPAEWGVDAAPQVSGTGPFTYRLESFSGGLHYDGLSVDADSGAIQWVPPLQPSGVGEVLLRVSSPTGTDVKPVPLRLTCDGVNLRLACGCRAGTDGAPALLVVLTLAAAAWRRRACP